MIVAIVQDMQKNILSLPVNEDYLPTFEIKTEVFVPKSA